ncbi:MAG: Rsd/AlgQ family anti-sigma factor [Granulosicoccaceae bacterium]
MEPVSVEQSEKTSTEAPRVDRRQSIGGTVRKLVGERQEVLVRFCQLAGVTGADEVEDDELDDIGFQPSVADLEAFCESLMDYLGSGHFELYQRIIDGHERRHGVLRAAQQFYPTIAETTQFLVEFNDKYDHFEGSVDECQSLRADLNKVGKAISLRSDFEDKILNALQG